MQDLKNESLHWQNENRYLVWSQLSKSKLKKIHMVLTGSANHFVRGGIPMPTSLKLKTLKTLKLKKKLTT